MATSINQDTVTLANAVALSPPNVVPIQDDVPPKVDLRSEDSISIRRGRSMTAFLFEEIAGKRLKCYEKWKLWLTLFIIMTLIAVIAIILATVFAVKYSNSFNSRTEAVTAQHTLLYELIHDETANFTDHTDEARKIFNTFDDDNDGVWNKEEFDNHFLLTSGTKTTFDDMDQNNDDILSWKEIAFSLVRYNLSQSYIPIVQQMYNYTFPNSSDASTNPLFNGYAANIYLNSYQIDDFGYITRSYFYQFRVNINFKKTDIDENNVIDFEEYSRTVGDDTKLAFFRNWELDSVLQFLNQTRDNNDERNYSSISTAFESHPDMCPSTSHSTAAQSRRRLWYGDEPQLSDDGYFYTYTYNWPPCEAVITCSNFDSDSLFDWSGCTQNEVNWLVSCITSAFDRFMKQETDFEDCWDEMLDCMGGSNFIGDCAPYCWCQCNGECELQQMFGCRGCPSGIDLSNDVGNRRRLGCKSCVCGCSSCQSCICFSGDSQMLIKRDDTVQDVLLKDLKVGDYVQTKLSEWSKVWFIKKQLGDFEFLNLYFDEYEYVTMTRDHLVYVGDYISDTNMKRADEIRIGDTIFVMNDLNSTLFVKREIIDIESVISSDGAYSPATMDGSIVVSKVLSSCYAQSPEMAQKLHDAAAIFRLISKYNAKLAVIITNVFYDFVFMRLRKTYGLKVAFTVFNAYSTPFIVVSTLIITIFCITRSFSYFF